MSQTMDTSAHADAEFSWRSVAALVLCCGLLAICCALIVFGSAWVAVLEPAVIGFLSFVMFVSAAAFVVLPLWFLLGSRRNF